MSNLFSGVRGQERAVRILSSQLDSGNLSHAYLFLGKVGSGKEYLCRIFSRYILCGENKDDDCVDCNKFQKGVHPDFIYINGKDGIKIETIRESIERLNLSPNLSRKKVLLLTDVENMSIEAANALLKTLEEPPADSVIILLAVTEKSLPQTIVSRSQVIKLNVLIDEDIRKIISKEFGEDNLEQIISLADGNIDKAKGMMESKDMLSSSLKLFEDVNKVNNSSSIVEKFKIIEKYDKEKKIKELFEAYSKDIFKRISEKISSGVNAQKDVEMGKEILKIYANLNYNVSLRISLEKIVLKEQLDV